MPKLMLDRAKQAIHYDPETGRLTWLVDEGKRRVGKEAGGSLMKGYKRLRIDKEQYSHHQVAWLLVTGEWPASSIDHINRIKTDNRWDNLRLATQSQNNANRLPLSKSGLPKGVARIRDRFCGQGWKDGRRYYLGVYATPEEAHAAYVAFVSRGFGPYACVSHNDTSFQAAERADAAKQAGEMKIPRRPRGPRSKSGLPKGVYRVCKRFGAQGWRGGKKYALGYYDTPEQAHGAYLAFQETKAPSIIGANP